MAKDLVAEYKTLLTKEEYDRIYASVQSPTSANTQTNYYLDTKRFTLKASDAALRVKKRSNYVLTLERKKGYQTIRIDEDITEEEFNIIKTEGRIPNQKVMNELSEIIKDQSIVNYLTLTTYRITFPYRKGKVALDKVEYVNTIDYELEYTGVNDDITKFDFIQFIKENNIAYKKSQSKLKRAFEAYRRR